MVESGIFPILIERRCRIQSGTIADEMPFPLDEDGFLDSSAQQARFDSALTPGAFVSPQIAARAGALVLLGEPGVGKTTVFRRITESPEYATQVPSSTLVWIDAADLTDASFEGLLGYHLRGLPEKPAEAPGDGTGENDGLSPILTVVVDQIDESPLVQRLAGRIRTALQGRDTSRLRFLLACRTADYPVDLTDVLTVACGKCVLADLVPLTRDEAVELASSADGVEGEGLIRAIVNAQAGILANTPLTLGLLVRTYRQTGSLEGNPAELFAKGVTHLLEEHDPARQIAEDETSLEQRRMIAERIAGRLLLSGRHAIWRGSVLESGEQDLNADALVGGRESSISGSFEVTKRMVRATLATAVFAGRGEKRLGFRHGSIAAYLAARYILDRDIPRAQLERLFLVSGGDDTRSIPTLLRETAAWLVTLMPAHAEWLVEADVESLVSHSNIVDSDAVKAMIVDALLRRASEVELTETVWNRGLRRLDHPGFKGQLLEVLQESDGREPDDWSSLARVRMAVRLARMAAPPALAAPLLDLAERETWSAHMRQLAALAAFDADPDQAAPRLTRILQRFADGTHAKELDPDDEFRGSLLQMLWPTYLSVEEVLPHLRRRRRRNLIGTYFMFETKFPSELPEQDIPIVLQWAREQLDDEPNEVEGETLADDPQTLADLPEERPVGRLDTELVEAIVDRVLASNDAFSYVDDVAELILPRLKRYDQPPLPAPVDLGDEDGGEPAESRKLRRALALSLLRVVADADDTDQIGIWHVMSGWGQSSASFLRRQSAERAGLRRAGRRAILAEEDFEWAYEASIEAQRVGSEKLARSLAQAAAELFNPDLVQPGEFALAHQHDPAWQHIRYWFDPVNVDSEAGKKFREGRALRRSIKDERWSQATEFASRLNRNFRDVIDGNTEAFWRLLWNLQLDPTTGRGRAPRLDDDVLGFPGIEALEGDPSESLVLAATEYVRKEHDRRTEWLGTEQYDKRAWAGYLALGLLEKTGRLVGLPETAWASWVGAVIWFPAVPINAGDRDLKSRLLAHCAKYAAADLAEAAEAFVKGELAHGGHASEIELIDPGWDARLADAWALLLDEIAAVVISAVHREVAPSDAPSPADSDIGDSKLVPPPVVLDTLPDSVASALRLWETMLLALYRADGHRASEIAHDRLKASAAEPHERPIAIMAAKALLRTDAQRYWPKIFPIISRDEELSQGVATACATGRGESYFFADVDEEHLGNIYRWLSGPFPPESDTQRDGVYFVSPKEEAREWRDHILQQLSTRGTPRSVQVLTTLASEHPDRLIVKSNLLRARTNVAATAWSAPSSDEVAALFEDTRRRLVRSEDELTDLVIEVMRVIQMELPAHGELLWDRIPRRLLPKNWGLNQAWRPKPEAALSAYLCHELSLRLGKRGLAVNREVLVRPTNEYGAGDSTDILVECTMRDDPIHGPVPSAFSIVIEVKGSWNDELLTAQRSQLAARYLPDVFSKAGIYLVGWYPVELWTDKGDYRRSKVTGVSRENIARDLDAQASEIRAELMLRTVPILLDVPRPHTSQSDTE